MGDYEIIQALQYINTTNHTDAGLRGWDEHCHGVTTWFTYIVAITCFSTYVAVPLINFGFLCCEKIEDEPLLVQQWDIDPLADRNLQKFQKLRKYELNMIRLLCFWAGLYKPEKSGMAGYIFFIPQAVNLLCCPIILILFPRCSHVYQDFTRVDPSQISVICAQLACGSGFVIFILWHYLGPLKLWEDDFLRTLDQGGYVDQQKQLYKLIRKWRRTVFVCFIWGGFLCFICPFTFYIHRKYQEDRHREYTLGCLWKITEWELARALCMLAAGYVWIVFLFHVWIYKMILKIFTAELDEHLSSNLEIDEETAKTINKWSRSIKRFLYIFFWLIIYGCVGFMGLQVGVMISDTMQSWGALYNGTFVFLGITGTCFCGCCCSIVRLDSQRLKDNCRFASQLLFFTILIGVFSTEKGNELVRGALVSAFFFGIMIYFIMSRGYDTLHLTMEVSVALRNQPRQALTGLLGVLGLKKERKEQIEKAVVISKEVGGLMKRSYSEHSAKLMLEAVQKATELSSVYGDVFGSLERLLEGSKYQKDFEKILKKTKELRNDFSFAYKTASHNMVVLQGIVDEKMEDMESMRDLFVQKMKSWVRVYKDPTNEKSLEFLKESTDELEMILTFLKHLGVNVDIFRQSNRFVGSLLETAKTTSTDERVAEKIAKRKSNEFAEELLGIVEKETRSRISVTLDTLSLTEENRNKVNILTEMIIATARSKSFDKQRKLFAEVRQIIGNNPKLQQMEFFLSCTAKTLSEQGYISGFEKESTASEDQIIDSATVDIDELD